MTPFALLLIAASAGLHAVWNLMGRSHRSNPVGFFLRMDIVTVAIGLPLFAVALILLPDLPPRAWVYGAASGVLCGIYYYTLGEGYRRSDLSMVYPLARALPILMLAGWDAARGRTPSPAGWLGLGMVTVGCLVLASPNRLKSPRELLWPALSALCIFGFTVIDKTAAEMVPPGPLSAARYLYVFYVTALLALVPLMRATGTRIRGSSGWKLPAVGALADFGGYWLTLWAFQMAGRASYVFALRQLSIVLGVAGALFLYPEERGKPERLPASVVIVAGLVMLALAG
jgi:uncharacterized membrane protein